MNYFCFSLEADVALERFTHHLSHLDPVRSFRLKEKIDLCPYMVILIGTSPFIERNIQNNPVDQDMLVSLHRAWGILRRGYDHLSGGILPEPQQIQREMELITNYGNRFSNKPNNSGTLLYQLKGHKDVFLIFLPEKEPEGISSVEIRSICNLRQVDLGYIPLHAGGVIHSGGLYIFSGPSGAGKSTVSELSTSIGDTILDHDQLMIHPLPGSGYSANAWGYNLQTSSIPVRGIFRLVQDITDQLVPLSQSRTVKWIWEQCFEVTGTMLPEDRFPVLFNRIAALSRVIPGHELHFRKVPDFWQLIDSEVGLG
jgi:hypothetical protein